jgi:hypothetical protein
LVVAEEVLAVSPQPEQSAQMAAIEVPGLESFSRAELQDFLLKIFDLLLARELLKELASFREAHACCAKSV